MSLVQFDFKRINRTDDSSKEFKRFLSAANGYEIQELMYKFPDEQKDSLIAYYVIRPNSSEAIYDISLGKLELVDLGDYLDVVMSREELTG
jgi:hypothetical protein|tara:strand:+ start:84 stop:356 length:273 start_codon:yes stop_codon:yes gene_type:complete